MVLVLREQRAGLIGGVAGAAVLPDYDLFGVGTESYSRSLVTHVLRCELQINELLSGM